MQFSGPSQAEGSRGSDVRVKNTSMLMEMTYMRLVRIEHLVCSSKSILDGLLVRATSLYGRLKEDVTTGRGAREEETAFDKRTPDAHSKKRKQSPLDELLLGIEAIYRSCQSVHGPKGPAPPQSFRIETRLATQSVRQDARLVSLTCERQPRSEKRTKGDESSAFDFEMLSDQKVVFNETLPGEEQKKRRKPSLGFKMTSAAPFLDELSLFPHWIKDNCLARLGQRNRSPDPSVLIQGKPRGGVKACAASGKNGISEDSLPARRPAPALPEAEQCFEDKLHGRKSSAILKAPPSTQAGGKASITSPLGPRFCTNSWLASFRRRPPTR